MEISQGCERNQVTLTWDKMGEDLIIRIFNTNAHIGAVAVGEYDAVHNRSSASLISLLGHKEGQIALDAAHKIINKTRQKVCVIAGIHVDNITLEEIQTITENCNQLIDKLLTQI